MLLLRTTAVLASSLARATAFVDYGLVYPASFDVGIASTLEGDADYTKQSITLSPSSPFLTLDYGTELAGFPFFDIASLSAPTQIEVKYSEQYNALADAQSDGPWTFVNGLANTFRMETFILTSTGRTESFFIQGGQRWETVRLLTNTTVTFSAIGMNASSAHIPAADLPAKFSTSNDLFNGIWNLGGVVAQTSQSDKGLGLANYTMSFMTKIVRGGTGWTVASGILPDGASFVLTSDYPTDNTFVNTNRTLLPPNTLIFNFGWCAVNEEQWYNISTTLTASGYNVTLDGKPIAFVPVAEAAYYAASQRLTSGSPTGGTFGFGPFQDEAAYVKDVLVTAANGTTLYQNNMTSEDVLIEYNVASLAKSVCMDGAKRDRLVWIGEFYHTTRIILASTRRIDYILGTIAFEFERQLSDGPFAGFVPIDPQLGSRPENKDAFMNQYGGLIDYQDLFLCAIGNSFRSTSDIANLSPYWTNIRALAKARLA
ncbi:hypothetical protein LTR62_004415 [Meristemomyces frigidus]|uniref:Uncharacterized protein n=1 Tax=Meristemomyces frigidus TaxID=1508187 RepID=A0AAN7TEZ7_9PEZI|nr:hypothetical protein LTR62_004415 [Meristemomyces frigidus]